MASATVTSYDAVLKELWPQSDIENLVNEGAPLLAMMPKEQDAFQGDILSLALQHGNPQGRSATFTNAQGNANPSTMVKFQLTRVRDYSVFTLDTEVIEASKSNRGAIVRALENESRSAMEQLSRSWHGALYGDASGSIGNVATSGITTTALTLDDVNDVVNFEINMEVVGAATATGALRDSGNSATITGVNRDTGVLTTDSNWTTQISGLTDGDFLFVEGDAANAGSTVKASGMLAWLPTAAPSSTAFFGVDRSVDTDRLGGVRYDGSSDGTKKEALMQGLARLSRNGSGARASHIFMNTKDFGDLLVELESSVERVSVDVGNVSFSGIKFRSAAGSPMVFEDYQCPQGQAFALKMSTWKWYGLGGGIHLIQVDGNRGLRQSAADGIEFRAVYRGQLGCTAPGFNANITLP